MILPELKKGYITIFWLGYSAPKNPRTTQQLLVVCGLALLTRFFTNLEALGNGLGCRG